MMRSSREISSARRRFIHRVTAFFGASLALLWRERGFARAMLAQNGALPAERPSNPTSAANVGPPGAMVARDNAPLRVYDGAEGITGSHFNRAASLPWENSGGDWFDMDGVPQGRKAFAQMSSQAPGPFDADITPLVKKWYANGNSGALLRIAGGEAHIAPRRNANPPVRPVVQIKLADGSSLECACTASGVANPSTSQGIVADDIVLGQNANFVLQFELPAMGGAFASARLRITSFYNYSQPLRIDVFELRAPRLFAGGSPSSGLADKYAQDVGIEADADVYFAVKFNEKTWRADYFQSGPIMGTETIGIDPDLRIPNINMVYRPGDFGPCAVSHSWANKSGKPTGPLAANPRNGLAIRESIPGSQYLEKQHPATPEECYFRYGLRLKKRLSVRRRGQKTAGIRRPLRSLE